MAVCSLVKCHKPYLAKGYCRYHYKWWRKYGDPLHYEKLISPKANLAKIISRSDAKKLGLTRYYTGKDCLICRIPTERRTCDGSCVPCKLKSNKIYLVNWYKNHREERLEYANKYRLANKGKCKAWSMARKIAVKKATPDWANLENIKHVYENCPEGYQVDHIEPIKGKLICGLHVEYNLQYLTPQDNFKKNNKFEPYIKINVE